jgi:hypothetical protein
VEERPGFPRRFRYRSGTEGGGEEEGEGEGEGLHLHKPRACDTAGDSAVAENSRRMRLPAAVGSTPRTRIPPYLLQRGSCPRRVRRVEEGAGRSGKNSHTRFLRAFGSTEKDWPCVDGAVDPRLWRRPVCYSKVRRRKWRKKSWKYERPWGAPPEGGGGLHLFALAGGRNGAEGGQRKKKEEDPRPARP